MFKFLLSSDLYPSFQLTTDPLGWEGLRYALVRDTKYHGITFSVSLELTFEKKAAQYIRGVYEVLGIEGVCRLTIFEYNANELRDEEVYSGRLDFTQYSTSPKGVTVPLVETGFTRKFLNGDALDIDLFKLSSQGGAALPALAPLTVSLHSQPIIKRYDATVTAAHLRSASNFVTNGESRFQTLYFGAGAPEPDEFGIGVLANGPFTIKSGGPEAVPIFPITEAGNYLLDFSFITELTVKQGLPEPLQIDARFRKADATYYLRVGDEPAIQLNSFSVSDQQGDLHQAVTLSHTATYFLQANTPVYLYAVLHVYDINRDQLLDTYSFEVYQDIVRGSYFRLQAVTTTPVTTTQGVLAHEALARCVQSVTDAPASFYSEYFGRTDLGYAADGPGALRLITSSWLVRNFPLSEKPFFASFRDLYESFDATDCLGCGIELQQSRQVVRVEDRAHFYQPVEVLRLYSVQDIKKSTVGERFYNAVEIGFQKWGSSSANGLREVNGSRTYTLPLTQVKNTYTALSPYVAAGYLLEETRRDQYQATSGKESRGDGDNYLICLSRTDTGYETERRQAFTLVDGVLAPNDTYNLRLTPGRSLRRHGAWLHAGLLRQADRTITRGEVQGSDHLATQLDSEAVPVVEDQDIPVSSLAPALYQPEVYEFTATLRTSELRRLYAQPYGLVSVPNGNGPRLRGFVLKLEVTPNTRLCTLQLLRYD